MEDPDADAAEDDAGKFDLDSLPILPFAFVQAPPPTIHSLLSWCPWLEAEGDEQEEVEEEDDDGEPASKKQRQS